VSNIIKIDKKSEMESVRGRDRHMGPPMIWYDGHLIPWEVDDCGAYKVGSDR